MKARKDLFANPILFFTLAQAQSVGSECVDIRELGMPRANCFIDCCTAFQLAINGKKKK